VRGASLRGGNLRGIVQGF